MTGLLPDRGIGRRVASGFGAIAVLLVLDGGGMRAEAQTETEVAASNFALAVDLCLQNVRTADTAPDSFRAAGFTLRDADEGTFIFNAPGVSGFLSPLLITEWCWVESLQLNFAQVQTIGHERALYRYPQGTSGPAQRGELANGCPSISLLVANRIAMLEFRNAGFWEGCDSPETGGVLFN